MNSEDSVNRDALLEALAAELTLAAHCVTLRTRTQGTWLDLELDLWRALANKVKPWGQASRGDRKVASAPLIEATKGQGPGVEIDAAVESALLVLEFHHGLRVEGYLSLVTSSMPAANRLGKWPA